MKEKVLLKELREKDTKALVKELADTEKKITELKFKATFLKLKNYQEITNERKKAARIWTILAEKAMENLRKEENAKEK